MASTLSNLFNNLSKGIHKIKCKYGDVDKKVETYVITYEVCECFLEYTNFKNNLIEYKIYVATITINKSLTKS